MYSEIAGTSAKLREEQSTIIADSEQTHSCGHQKASVCLGSARIRMSNTVTIRSKPDAILQAMCPMRKSREPAAQFYVSMHSHLAIIIFIIKAATENQITFSKFSVTVSSLVQNNMESQEWIFHADHPAFRGIAIHDLPTLPLDVSVPPRVLNRRRNAISTSCNISVPEPRMSRRGAISYEEDHDFARFVRGLSKF